MLAWGLMLMLAVVGFLFCLLPLSAWVWWSAQGALGRARDDGRPADGLVRGARGIAVAATIWQSLLGLGLLLNAL